MDWHRKAGNQGKGIQKQVVCNGQVNLGQVQADELCINIQGKQKVWMATAMSVFSRLFIWGEVSTKRDKKLIQRLMLKVREAAGSLSQPVLVAIDGFAAYPKAILKAFSEKVYTGKPERPPRIPWPDLQIVQVVKSRSGRKLKEISRRLVHGSLNRVYERTFVKLPIHQTSNIEHSLSMRKVIPLMENTPFVCPIRQ